MTGQITDGAQAALTFLESIAGVDHDLAWWVEFLAAISGSVAIGAGPGYLPRVLRELAADIEAIESEAAPTSTRGRLQ
jgi:hypothetical protein